MRRCELCGRPIGERDNVCHPCAKHITALIARIEAATLTDWPARDIPDGDTFIIERARRHDQMMIFGTDEIRRKATR